MRPAGRGMLDSLYFKYPTFPARRVPGHESGQEECTVAIVGAGPIGMTAALTLARYGIASVLLDRKDTFNDGSRAICIARPSFQIFEQLGVVEPFLAKSLGWTRGKSFYRDRQIYQFEMPHAPHDKYLPMYNLEQQYIEQFLHDAVAAEPLIDMRWQSDAIAIDQANSHVTLRIKSPFGEYNLDADYVLAADGARSPLRSLMGLRLNGENYEGHYVIADVRMQHDYPTERRAFFEPKSNPGGTVLVHKQPDDIWRIDYQLKPGESGAEATREDNIRSRLAAILDDIGHKGTWELEWWSIYTANTLALDDYKHGRVMFIGDSAHIVPIFGVRGLNNGLADAFNAGWKLAYVLNGWSQPSLLDSYTPERRGATLDVFANAGKSTRFMTPPTRGYRLMREAVLSLALRHDFARAFADPRQMQPYTYADSPLTQTGDAGEGPRLGALAPNVRNPDGTFLLDGPAGGFTLLTFAASADPAIPLGLQAAMKAKDPLFRITLCGTQSEAARIYGASTGTTFLLRPDLHVAARFPSIQPDALLRALDKAMGKATS